MKLCAKAQIKEPIAKQETETRIEGLRPSIWEMEAKVGWMTVDVRRKDVPVQKASMAVPWRSWAIIFGVSQVR